MLKLMVRPEYSNKRDLTYSKFHRTFGYQCYAMNLDWIEYRRKDGTYKIVAIIEDKDSRANVGQWMDKKSSVFLAIANALNVPAYLVLHNCNEQTASSPDAWVFRVINLNQKKEKLFNKDEYKEFIETRGIDV